MNTPSLTALYRVLPAFKMENNRRGDGKLTNRLWFTYDKVIEGIVEALSTDAFSKVLPKEVDAEEVRRDLIQVFEANCLQVFNDLLDEHDVIEKLTLVESTLGPTIKGKEYPAPAKQSPVEAATVYTLEKKLAQKKALDDRIAELESQVANQRHELDETRKRARRIASDFDVARSRYAIPSSEDADTEPEPDDN